MTYHVTSLSISICLIKRHSLVIVTFVLACMDKMAQCLEHILHREVPCKLQKFQYECICVRKQSSEKSPCPKQAQNQPELYFGV